MTQLRKNNDVAVFAGLKGSYAKMLKSFFSAYFQIPQDRLADKAVVRMILMDMEAAHLKVRAAQPNELNHLNSTIQTDLDRAGSSRNPGSAEIARYLSGVYLPEKMAAMQWETQTGELKKKIDEYIALLDKTFEQIVQTLKEITDEKPISAAELTNKLDQLEAQCATLEKETNKLEIEIEASEGKLRPLAQQAHAAAGADVEAPTHEGLTATEQFKRD